MYVPRATPAQARDCTVDVPIFGIRQHVKQHRKAFDVFFEQRLHGFRRHIATRKSCSA